MAETAPEQPGYKIAGRYELIDVIGRGGLGLVWKAKDHQTGQRVAVKMLSEEAHGNPQHIERLKREQQALVALAGTAAVAFIDLATSSSGKLCLVMELLEGMDLEERLYALESAGKRIGTDELLTILAPIVATLERAHHVGILHRDLKPANVYLVSERVGGGVRLLDFGFALQRSARPLTQAGTVLGSPSYIAPEIWIGRRDQLDQRADVYSFGVLVYRALAGRLPFKGETLKDKFFATTRAPRPSLHEHAPELPAEIDEWVEQVMAIEPGRRFRSIRGAWNALLAILGVADLAEALVSEEDLALARQAAAPLLGESEEKAPPPPPVRRPPPAAIPKLTPAPAPEESTSWTGAMKKAVGVMRRLGDALRPSDPTPQPAPVQRQRHAQPQGEKSIATDWLARSDFTSKPPPAQSEPIESPADSVRVARVIGVGERKESPLEPVSPNASLFAVGDVEPGAGERSMVTEWLAPTELARDESDEAPVVSRDTIPLMDDDLEVESLRGSKLAEASMEVRGTSTQGARSASKERRKASKKKAAEANAAKKKAAAKKSRKRKTAKKSGAKKATSRKTSPGGRKSKPGSRKSKPGSRKSSPGSRKSKPGGRKSNPGGKRTRKSKPSKTKS